MEASVEGEHSIMGATYLLNKVTQDTHANR